MCTLAVHRCDCVYTSGMHDIVELGLVRPRIKSVQLPSQQ